MEHLDVITLGGNAILPSQQAGTIHEQFEITRVSMAQIAKLVAAGRNVVMSHGNGPIVGNILLRNEAVRDSIAPMPLGICVADSQGGIGYMLQQVLRNALVDEGVERDVVTLVTQVRISPEDPAFTRPTKPIGPYYTKDQADALTRDGGWQMVEDSRRRGYRRVVPSPRPLEIIEEEAAKQLLERGAIVITVGGGGIPVVEKDGKLHGVEAVVDKDYATAVLARDLKAERMIIITDIDAVYRNFGTPRQEALRHLSVDEAAAMAVELPEGSMGSKLDAAAQYVADTGGIAIITRPEDLMDAVGGNAGTHITRLGRPSP